MKDYRKLISNMFYYLFVSFLALLYILPLLWMVSTSLKTQYEVLKIPPILIPTPPHWRNYIEIFRRIPLGRYFLNTIMIALTTMLGSIFSCTFVGYAFSKLRWPGKNLFFIILLATMMIPFPTVMIPLFLTFRRLGWINTYLPLIVPTFCASPYLTFLARQFFMSIPTELIDAARIDGASEPQIYLKLMLPLCKPLVIVIGLFEFLYAWNDFTGPLIYINSQEKFTLAIGLQLFSGAHMSEWHLQMAAGSLVTLPIIFLFFLLQRYFIEGITLTGIK